MKNDPCREVFEYHEATKHHFDRFAKSLGYMDWANQPEPFRVFEGAQQVPLPLLEKDPAASNADLYSRKNNPVRPFSLETVGGFLELSMGLSAWKTIPGSRWALRMNPSSGNLHPTETHLVLPSMEGVEAGIFHYNPFMHALERRAFLPERSREKIAGYFESPGFMAALSSIYWRESWKYGERAFRYCNHDAGHALACLSISANLFGWKIAYLNGVSDADAETVLGFDKTDWIPQDREHPDMLCYVFPSSENMERRDLSPEIVAEFETLEFSGIPNGLSHEYFPWEVVERAGRATEKPRTDPLVVSFDEAPFFIEAASELSAPEIIRKRRSAQAFDRTGGMDANRFLSMLDKTIPRKNVAPFDSGLSPSRINLLIFAHNVAGLKQGLYLFARNNEDADAIRSISRREFLWETVQEGFPLFLLKDGNFRAEAAEVSCYQEIAGESAFSLGMIARFREEIEKAPWIYKSLFWESGMIGQVLYLEAEAFGARGTGIGCYFDDPVHDILGLPDDRFQSLYHFTAGTPVEDGRLKSLPPYYHLERSRRS